MSIDENDIDDIIVSLFNGEKNALPYAEKIRKNNDKSAGKVVPLRLSRLVRGVAMTRVGTLCRLRGSIPILFRSGN